MHDLVVEIRRIQAQLDKAVFTYKQRGKERAQAEHDYKVALSQKILMLRADNQPVTIVNDLARGDAEVANLRLKRDISDVLYESAREAINNYKLQIRVLDAQIGREWNNGG